MIAKLFDHHIFFFSRIILQPSQRKTQEPTWNCYALTWLHVLHIISSHACDDNICGKLEQTAPQKKPGAAQV